MNSLNLLSRTLACATLATVACNGAFAATNSSTPTTTAPATQSMRLSETPDAYKVTLSGADPSKLQVNFKDHTLHVISGPASGGASYEQIFDLPAADLAQSLSVNPDKETIVISVPKTSENLSASSTAPAMNPVTVAPPPLSSRSQQAGSIQSQMLQQLAAMQRQMNAMMNDTMADNDDPIASLAALAHGLGMGGMSSSAVTIEDQGANYIIRAKNVDDATKLNVAVDNGNILKITTTSKTSQAQSYQSSHSTQMMTLPTAVQSDKMSTKREGDAIIVTLPKA